MERVASWLRRCPGVKDVALVGAWLTLCPWVRPHPDRWDLGTEPGAAPCRQVGWSQLCLLLGSIVDRTGCRGRAWGLCHHFRLVSTVAVFLRASWGETGGRRSSAAWFSRTRLLCTWHAESSCRRWCHSFSPGVTFGEPPRECSPWAAA